MYKLFYVTENTWKMKQFIPCYFKPLTQCQDSDHPSFYTLTTNELVIQLWHVVLMQLHCHLVNQHEIMAAKQKHCWPTGINVGTPAVMVTKMQDALSGTDIGQSRSAV